MASQTAYKPAVAALTSFAFGDFAAVHGMTAAIAEFERLQTAAKSSETVTRPRVPAAADNVDTLQMSTADMYAYFKRTAPYAHLRDYLARDLDPEWRPRFEALASLQGKPSSFFKAFYQLKDSYACWRHRPADIAAYEARYWSGLESLARRRKAADWRAACASAVSDVRRLALGHQQYYSRPIVDIRETVIALVRRGRELLGNVPALATESDAQRKAA